MKQIEHDEQTHWPVEQLKFSSNLWEGLIPASMLLSSSLRSDLCLTEIRCSVVLMGDSPLVCPDWAPPWLTARILVETKQASSDGPKDPTVGKRPFLVLKFWAPAHLGDGYLFGPFPSPLTGVSKSSKWSQSSKEIVDEMQPLGNSKSLLPLVPARLLFFGLCNLLMEGSTRLGLLTANGLAPGLKVCVLALPGS